jgi:Polysaccharide deacetylase
MKLRSRFLVFGILFACGIILAACASHKTAQFVFPIETMQRPPGNLNPEQVPLFVSFGSDDNQFSGLEASGGGGGVHFLTDLFASHTNPVGSGDARNFDGKSPHYSLYVNTIYITPQGDEDPALVKQAWKEAVDHGHEIAVHTHTHPHGKDFSAKQWEDEMGLCIKTLTQPDGMNIPRNQITGFRTPFLEYGDPTFTAASHEGFVYDCSIEEGHQSDQDGRNYIWPYVLDHGSPGNSATYKTDELPLVGDHPGLWELPVYTFIVPPDDLCESYGVTPGLRARMRKVSDDFDVDQGKITGMDWNLWFEYGMTKAEFIATLKYTLDLRLKGNRCPMTVGIHSADYADRSTENPPHATVQERREALTAILDYAISKPEVRVVSARELLGWLHAPVPLTKPVATAAHTNDLGAGFRYSVFNPKVAPDPAYFVRVGREMAERFPGAKPEGIWIVTRIRDRGAVLSFPMKDTGDPLIFGRDEADPNEPALSKFDELGFRIWLQVEPGYSSVEKLIHIVLQRYGHHPCVVGVGVDVEWYNSTNPDGGDPVTDAVATKWLAAARSYNPKFRLFLKHWLPEKMPPTVREGLLFVDDSQILPSLDAMVDEFAVWGKTFAPSPVAFQFGYPSDRPWWSQLKDPPKEIGTRILQATPNTEALFWVDFSVTEVFPPNPSAH